MVEINVWMQQFLAALDETFEDRVWFVGLQGSYGRGEATQTSDIDMVVILDELCAADVQLYNSMLDTLPHRELLCGFLSGKRELLDWDASDLFQLYYDTTPIRGSLDALLPLLDETAVRRAIRLGVCNLYHGCVHNMLYDKNENILRGLYKSASFVVQAICFQQTGCYVRHQNELISMVEADEQIVLKTFLRLKNGGEVQFQEMSEILFAWCKHWIEKSR